MDNIQSIAVVIIGRNEGQRLIDCFLSLLSQTHKIIYVDSGSTDQSVANAIELGVTVVSLDMSRPFTAARARNAGFSKLCELYPEAQYVQFLDGDCRVADQWLNQAFTFIKSKPSVAVVCGRRREIYPEKSVYNLLCDIEWNTPIGEAKACGGDALMRVEAFKAVDGFNEMLIAGEEPELCVRLRQAGWLIWRLDAEMTKHDAALFKFSQWWKRTTRAGYAFAQGADLHGGPPEYHWVAEMKRARIWGAYIPILALILVVVKPLLALILLTLYPLQILKLTLKSNFPFKVALIHAYYLVIGKFPEMVGQSKFLWRKFHHKKIQLIEYK